MIDKRFAIKKLRNFRTNKIFKAVKKTLKHFSLDNLESNVDGDNFTRIIYDNAELTGRSKVDDGSSIGSLLNGISAGNGFGKDNYEFDFKTFSSIRNGQIQKEFDIDYTSLDTSPLCKITQLGLEKDILF